MPRPEPGGGRRSALGPALLGVLAAVLVVTGVVVWRDGPGAPVVPPAVAEQETPAQPALPQARPAAPAAARRPGAPRRLAVPALGVDTAVDAVALRGRVLVPPADPRRLGWWAGSAPAGASRGATVVAGHTVHTGGGALDDLETLRPGDRVLVRTTTGPVRYRVASVRVLAKGALARRAERLLGGDGPGRLVLVTCEDWDGAGYRSNVVVVARPV